MSLIYQYQHLHEFLADAFRTKKSINPSYSIRSWALKLGMSSHGSLQQAIKGKRSIPRQYFFSLCQDLKLNEDEASYLEALISKQSAKTEQEKIYFEEVLEKKRPKSNTVSRAYLNNHRFFNNPLHGILRSLIQREDFVPEIGMIQKSLTFKVSQLEIKDCLNNLKDMNLIKEENGSFFNIAAPVTNKEDVPQVSVQNYHREMCKKAAEAVEKQNVEEREFNSFTLNIDTDKMPEIKQRIRDFLKEMSSEFETNINAKTYQINTHLFKIAESRSKS